MNYKLELKKDKATGRLSHHIKLPAGDTYGSIVLDTLQSLADHDERRAADALTSLAKALAGKFGKRETVVSLIAAIHDIEAGQVITPPQAGPDLLGSAPAASRSQRFDRRRPRLS